MAELDPKLSSPIRLTVMTMLTAVSDIEFTTLRDRLDMSESALSKHVKSLADAGYVKSRKGVHHGHRTTWLTLTANGRRALSDHVAALRGLIADVE